MKINVFLIITTLFFILSLVLVILATVSMVKKEKTPWKDYYPVLIKSDASLQTIIEDIQITIKPKAIVSEETSFFSITRFSSQESIKIKDLEKYLDPEDPRLDPYISGIKQFFNVNSGWSIVYIASDQSALWFYFKITAMCRQKGYTILLPGIDIPGKFILIILSILFLWFYLNPFKSAKWKVLKIISAIPWIYWMILAGDLYDSLSFFIIYPFYFQLIEKIVIFTEDLLIYKWTSITAMLLKGINYLLACFFIYGLSLKIETMIFPLIPILLNWIIAAGYFAFFLSYKYRKQHKLFRYIPVNSFYDIKQLIKIKIENIAFILIIILVITLIPIYYFARQEPQMAQFYIPVPGSIDLYRKPDAEIINDMSVYDYKNDFKYYNSNTRDLPNISDFIAHLRYQEGINFGGKYNPHENAGIDIDKFYINSSNKIVKTLQPFILEKTWTEQIFNNLQESSLEKMLIRQGDFKEFRLILINALYTDKFINWINSIYFFLLLIPLFLLYFYFKSSLLDGIKNLYIKRKLYTA